LKAVAVLDELAKAMGETIGEASMTHWSIEPFPEYDARPSANAAATSSALPANLAMASPAWSDGAIHTLADRWQLGVSAAQALQTHAEASVSQDILWRELPELEARQTLHADIAIAGVGTGGSVAAIAAAKADRSLSKPGQKPLKIIAIEPMAFPGGIGTGGGIHSYYWGIPGGLQRDIDQLTRQFMNRYQTPLGPGPLSDGPFNPWAKTIALQSLFAEHHIELLYGATLVQTHTRQGSVTSALLATDQGLLRLEAKAWIDGTGDGDLCTLAGADFTLGREHDGLLHAYTQSSGQLRELNGRIRMASTNTDAGFCDPTDPQDLTRARLEGIRQKVVDKQSNLDRVTYIAPALGLRQGRQIETEYVLSFDDQITRKRFPDAIGYSGCHYDNHATDYEFQSDESLFWVWALEQFRTPYAHEISYRMLVPRGLDNVWIASRCLGVSQDAHHALRMQRDMQRIGEAAGDAAVLALRQQSAARDVKPASLRALLDETGAFDKAPKGLEPEFGRDTPTTMLTAESDEQQAQAALTALNEGRADGQLWWLYRHPQQMRQAVLEQLENPNAQTSWFAACVAAMWGEAAAEPRLIQAINTLEYGYGDWPEPEPAPAGSVAAGKAAQPSAGPMHNQRLAPHWLTAAGLLRRCGSAACLPALAALIDRPTHANNTLTTVSLTLERLASSLGTDHAYLVRPMLDRMTTITRVGTQAYPQRPVGRHAHLAVQSRYDKPEDHPTPPAFGQNQYWNSVEDNTWQFHLAQARARLAWGVPVQPEAMAYLHDPRALVRRAMSQALSTTERASATADENAMMATLQR
jgi:hypothetical protein